MAGVASRPMRAAANVKVEHSGEWSEHASNTLTELSQWEGREQIMVGYTVTERGVCRVVAAVQS